MGGRERRGGRRRKQRGRWNGRTTPPSDVVPIAAGFGDHPIANPAHGRRVRTSRRRSEQQSRFVRGRQRELGSVRLRRPTVLFEGSGTLQRLGEKRRNRKRGCG